MATPKRSVRELYMRAAVYSFSRKKAPACYQARGGLSPSMGKGKLWRSTKFLSELPFGAIVKFVEL